jgi:hypothetical protein
VPFVFFIWTVIAVPLAIVIILRLYQYVDDCARRRDSALEISEISELIIPSAKSIRTWWRIILRRDDDPELDRRRRSFLFWLVVWNVYVIITIIIFVLFGQGG